jgi:hypothetical protein
MPRRQFVADLAAAVESVSIAGISDVQLGGDDGEFTFLCVADGTTLKISALIPGNSPARRMPTALPRLSWTSHSLLTLSQSYLTIPRVTNA